MSAACREHIRSLWGERGRSWETSPLGQNAAHAGLLLSSYLREAGDKGEAKRDLLLCSIQAGARASEVYAGAFARWKQHIQSRLGTAYAEKQLSVRGRAIVGLGNENVLETGITLHHTYGTPLFPGTGLKGLASHYCHQVWGEKKSEFKIGGDYHSIIFGTTEDSGHITFYDAWIEPVSLQAQNSGLVLDVMTPHHSQYYMAGSGDNKIAPSDFDDPTPVSFLSVSGSFYLALACDADGEKGHKWADLTMALLIQALEHWGIGGKTSAGYGRLGDPSKRLTPSGGGLSVPTDIPTEIRPGPFAVRSEVRVTRVEDPKGRGRIWFEAPDGLGGRVTQGAEPDVSVGETVTLWVVSAPKDGYNFSADPPPPPKKGGGKTRRR